MWTLPWQALWQLPSHIITAQAVAVGSVWRSWWQFSTFQCRIASFCIIWLLGYRDMDRIDIGIKMWYRYWYRYRKICNDIQPYPTHNEVVGGYTGFTPSVWMKWLRLLGGWHFIAATAIKPPKAACQFAADDILLYKICYNIQWIYFTIWEKGKEELSPLQYHFKSLHIISRHYKKSLLRSQIYHGYEELSTDTNYPIWRRQKLPYMKKTRKKKQVCGAACFMAAEIKFSEDVRPASRVRSVALTVLVGSISYLYILSSNFRRCVACEVSGKIWKFEFLAIF